MGNYRCYLSKIKESQLPVDAQKELAYLRKRLKEADDWGTYHFYCANGDYDFLPERLKKKYDKELKNES